MGNYVNIYALRVVLTDGVTYHEAAREIRNRLDCGHSLRHLEVGCLARRDDNGNVLLSPSKVEPMPNVFDLKLPVNHTWLQ